MTRLFGGRQLCGGRGGGGGAGGQDATLTLARARARALTLTLALALTILVVDEAVERRWEAVVAIAVEVDEMDGRPSMQGGKTADSNMSPPSGPSGCGDGRREGWG